jgi:hypothetical protein
MHYFPAYSVPSPYLPFPPQPVVSVQPILAVQTPMVPTKTIVQPAPYVPSPVIPFAVHPPRNPSPYYSRTPPPLDDGGAADMLPVLVQPQQALATPTHTHLTINVNTPQRHPTPLRDHPQDVPNANYPVFTTTPIVVPAAMTPRTVQGPSNAGLSVHFHCTPPPGTPLQLGDQSYWSSTKR